MKIILRIALCLFLVTSLISPALAVWCDDNPEPTYTPDMPEFHWNEGNAYYNAKAYDLAIASYEKAIAIDSAFFNAYHGLAFTYYALGRLDLALANYGEVIRLEPDYAQPYLKRAELHQFIGHMEEAEQDLDMFVELYGQYSVSYIARGDFFMNTKVYDRAAQDYAMAIERNPELTIAYIKRADALLLSGRTEEASEVFARAVVLIGTKVPPLDDADEIVLIDLIKSSSFGIAGKMNNTTRSFVPDVELITLLYAYGFFVMPENLDTGIMDGHFTRITVHFKSGESKSVGGLVAEEFGPEDFIIIYNAVVEAM